MTAAPLNLLRVVIGLNQGGVQQAVLNLVRGLDPQRFRATVCAIENSGAIGDEIAASGIEVVTLGLRRQPLGTVRALTRLMRERQTHIVHASSYHPSLYGRLAAIAAGVPVRISHEHVVFGRRRRQRVLLNRLLEPLTDGYIAVGRAVAEQVRSWYGYPARKVTIIHNGVDTQRFRPAQDKAAVRRQLGLDPDRPVVTMVARLDPEKGHRYLFDAIAALPSSQPAQWLIVGMGRGEATVRREAQERGVADRVRFLGLRRDIPELLAASDIYVLPTLQEGFPNSVLEAMAAGCAVLVSDFPGNLEVVTDGATGLVTPMADSPALAAALARLLDDPSRRAQLGAAARAHVEAELSVARYVERTAAYYEQLWQRSERRHGRA